MSDDRTVKVTVGDLGECLVTPAEAAEIYAVVKAISDGSGKVEVTLIDGGKARIKTILVVRQITGWDLKTANDFVANAPGKLPPILMSDLPRVEQAFREAGAQIKYPDLIERIGRLYRPEAEEGNP